MAPNGGEEACLVQHQGARLAVSVVRGTPGANLRRHDVLFIPPRRGSGANDRTADREDGARALVSNRRARRREPRSGPADGANSGRSGEANAWTQRRRRPLRLRRIGEHHRRARAGHRARRSGPVGGARHVVACRRAMWHFGKRSIVTAAATARSPGPRPLGLSRPTTTGDVGGCPCSRPPPWALHRGACHLRDLA